MCLCIGYGESPSYSGQAELVCFQVSLLERSTGLLRRGAASRYLLGLSLKMRWGKVVPTTAYFGEILAKYSCRYGSKHQKRLFVYSNYSK